MSTRSVVLETAGLTKRFGGVVASDGIDLQLHDGELLAVIGPNGAGKATLMSLLSGSIKPDSGAIRLAGRNITRMSVQARAARGLSRTFQIISVIPEMTVTENVALAVHSRRRSASRFWCSPLGNAKLRAAVEEALEQIGLGGRGKSPRRPSLLR